MVLLHLLVIRGRSVISRVAAPSWLGTLSILFFFFSGLVLCCGISPCFRFPSLRFTKKANKNANSEAENGNGSGFRVCQILPVFAT